MLRFQLDALSIDNFLRRVTYDVEQRFTQSQVRVIDIKGVNEVSVRGWYFAPKLQDSRGHSEYNATVNIFVDVYLANGELHNCQVAVNNPIDLTDYNRDIEWSYASLHEVRSMERVLAKEYTEALDALFYLIPSGIYRKTNIEYITGDSSNDKLYNLEFCGENVLEDAERLRATCKSQGYEVHDVVGITCSRHESNNADAIYLFNMLVSAYLTEVLAIKTADVTKNIKGHDEERLNTLTKVSQGISHAELLIYSAVHLTKTYPDVELKTFIDENSRVPYFHVVYFSEDTKEIVEWYHFTIFSGFKVVRTAEGLLSYEVAFDVNHKPYEYFISEYETSARFLATFLEALQSI